MGWVGAILILLGYFLISTKKINPATKNYQFINLIGSIFLMINAYNKGAIPLVALNLIWMLIAVKSLLKG